MTKRYLHVVKGPIGDDHRSSDASDGDGARMDSLPNPLPPLLPPEELKDRIFEVLRSLDTAAQLERESRDSLPNPLPPLLPPEELKGRIFETLRSLETAAQSEGKNGDPLTKPECHRTNGIATTDNAHTEAGRVAPMNCGRTAASFRYVFPAATRVHARMRRRHHRALRVGTAACLLLLVVAATVSLWAIRTVRQGAERQMSITRVAEERARVAEERARVAEEQARRAEASEALARAGKAKAEDEIRRLNEILRRRIDDDIRQLNEAQARKEKREKTAKGVNAVEELALGSMTPPLALERPLDARERARSAEELRQRRLLRLRKALERTENHDHATKGARDDIERQIDELRTALNAARLARRSVRSQAASKNEAIVAAKLDILDQSLRFEAARQGLSYEKLFREKLGGNKSRLIVSE